MLVSGWSYPDHALGQAHHVCVGLLRNAFHVGDVMETAGEVEAHFESGEIGNPFRHRLKLGRPLKVMAWCKHRNFSNPLIIAQGRSHP